MKIFWFSCFAFGIIHSTDIQWHESRGNWCDELAGNKTVVKTVSTGKYKKVALRCVSSHTSCQRTFTRKPILKKVEMEVPNYERRCCVGYTGANCLSRMTDHGSYEKITKGSRPGKEPAGICDAINTCIEDIRQEIKNLTVPNIKEPKVGIVVPGPEGQVGEKGDTGEPGKDGEAGKDGEPGKDGAQGSPGEIGPAGKMGETGEPGTPGQPGSDGSPGPVGNPGVQGPAGSQGPKGEPAVGVIGATGNIGSPGLAGPPGNTGLAGPPGPPGPPGIDGKCSDCTALTPNGDPTDVEREITSLNSNQFELSTEISFLKEQSRVRNKDLNEKLDDLIEKLNGIIVQTFTLEGKQEKLISTTNTLVQQNLDANCWTEIAVERKRIDELEKFVQISPTIAPKALTITIPVTEPPTTTEGSAYGSGEGYNDDDDYYELDSRVDG